jgi:hypothetical protein
LLASRRLDGKLGLFVALTLVVSALSLEIVTAASASTSFGAVADTYSRSDKPSTNYGRSVRISTQNQSGQIRRAYLRFNVSVPSGSAVTKATLRMYSESAGTSTPVELHGMAATTWGETSLTWNNAPVFDAAVISRAANYGNNAYVAFDATNLVTTSGLVSMALVTSDTKWQGFTSREGTNKPQLVVETTPIATTTTTAAPTTTTTVPPSTTTTLPPTTTTTTTAPPPTTTTTTTAPPPPAPSGALHSTSTQPFVDSAGNPVRLIGLNVIPVWNSSPGQTWALAKYQQIRDKGFNAVRFVLYWDNFESSRGVFNQTNLTTLDTAISRAKSAGLYVILDEIHLWGSGGFNNVPAWARTGDSVTTVATNGAGYLKMLAARYRSEVAVAGYDMVNEFYRSPVDQNAVLRAYDGLISAVRTVDPDKIVLLEPTYGDTSIAGTLADFSNLTNRRNVVWSLHDYFAGGDDDGYNSSGAQAGTYVWDGTTGYGTPDAAALERHLLVHLNKTQAAGIPMWIGEFGIGLGVTNHDQWIKEKVSLYNKYGLGRTWWEYYTSGAFSATNSDFTWKSWIGLLFGP